MILVFLRRYDLAYFVADASALFRCHEYLYVNRGKTGILAVYSNLSNANSHGILSLFLRINP